MAEVLRVVQLIFEINFRHSEEGPASEERVRASLVLWPDPLHLQHVCHLLQAPLQILAALHQILHVVDVGEIDLQSLEKFSFPFWQIAVSEHGQEISKVVS